MADTRFGLYPAVLKPDGTPSNNIEIAQIDDDTFSPSASKSKYRPGGSLDLSTVGLAFGEPMSQFGTCDLSTVLGNISPTVGLSLTNGAIFARQKRANESTFVGDSTAEHILYTSTKAFACLDSFEVNQDDEQGAKVMASVFHLSSDGMTPPVTKTLAVITGQPTPAYTSRFFMGHIDVNSVEVPGVTGYSIEYAKNYSLKRFNGDVFARLGSITFRDPTIRYRTTSGDLDAALNVFLNQVAGNMELYAYKEDVTAANGRAVLTNSVHVKHTADGEFSMDQDSVSKEEDGSYGFTVNVTGTMAVSVAAAAA